jgi:hypothetical protein
MNNHEGCALMDKTYPFILTLFSFFSLFLCTLLGCGGGGDSGGAAANGITTATINAAGVTTTIAPGSSIPIPDRALWESQMQSFGRIHCDQGEIQRTGTDESGVWYYDGIRTFQQIADYTGDPSWRLCADYVKAVYRPLALGGGGQVPGWQVFPHGLAEDFRSTGDALSRSAVVSLATQSAWAPQGGDADAEMSRETAYLIHAYMKAIEVGEARSPLLQQAVEFALGHLDQWSGSRIAPYVKPFMVGLTFEALIAYEERFGDGRILPAIQRTADWLWDEAWHPATRSFFYISCKPGSQAVTDECIGLPREPSPDLNLLIAPAYAWLYRRLGEVRFQQRGDEIFSGGVRGAWLDGGKQFSQNYRWSFDYIRNR